MKKVLILGSTGSIGRRALEVIRDFSDRFRVVGLSAHRNLELFEKQVDEFKPSHVCIAEERHRTAASRLEAKWGIPVYPGIDGLCELVHVSGADIVIVATVGVAGLLPTLAAIEQGMTIALANKEVLVAGGDLVMQQARAHGVSILPIDSEHSAVFQCLAGHKSGDVSRIILTASGGPFHEKNHDDMLCVGVEDALAHPTWSMGKKITIDSATLMNKGFEVIECRHLFNVSLDMIDVIVHRQSIIHSMVEFVDGSILAQLGVTDMYLPIQIALSWPERWHNPLSRLNFHELKELTFESPKRELFPCLQYAYDAARAGGTMPAVLNAANEIGVQRFLNKEITFLDIPGTIARVMEKHHVLHNPGLQDILDADGWAREEARQYVP